VPGLKLEGVRHRYGAHAALAIDSFEAAPGEHWLVLGPSGCGKTTLLHIVAGLLRPSEGEVEVAGQRLAALAGAALDRWRGATVGIMLQALHLVPHLSVRDNLRLAQYLARRPQDEARVAEALAGLGIADKAGRRPGELSQGERQRAALARALVNRPKLLLADEPTANLDDAAAAQAADLLLEQAAREGATLVVASHDARVKQKFRHTLELRAP
jgi:putative ABC transport system ATP-binding protein